MKNGNKLIKDVGSLIVMLILSAAVVVLAHTMANSGPVITAQPEDVTVEAAGETAAVKVQARGDGLTYQWYVKDRGGKKFGTSKVTKDTYSVKMTKERNGRQLYCVVTDKSGKTAQTNTVTIAIAGPEITAQPESVTVAKEGDQAATTVAASGDGLTYQWYVKDLNSDKFGKSKVTKNTYSVKMTEDRNGRQVYCVVTDSNGSTVQTETVTLSVAE